MGLCRAMQIHATVRRYQDVGDLFSKMSRKYTAYVLQLVFRLNQTDQISYISFRFSRPYFAYSCKGDCKSYDSMPEIMLEISFSSHSLPKKENLFITFST